jgi:predicted MFS family arabinose efflux permease
VFAACAAVVTWWVHVTVPMGSDDADDAVSTGARDDRSATPPRLATWALVVGSFLVGLSSVATWTFGRDLITVEGNASDLLASVMWIVIGAAGVGGALSGPLVQRIGVPASWMTLMIALAAASVGLAAAPANTWAVAAAAAVFGASYIAVTGVALLWAARLYPRRAAFGVGLSFFVIALGQAFGAPLAGVGAEHLGLPPVFYACAAVAVLGAALAPIIRVSPTA